MNEGQKRGANSEEANENTSKRTRSSAASADTQKFMDIGEMTVNQEEEPEIDEWAVDDHTGGALDA